jgi:hypothetical protein
VLLNEKRIEMKRKYILTIGAALLLLTACGPKRHSCYGKRRCISDTEKPAPLKQETPKRNA